MSPLIAAAAFAVLLAAHAIASPVRLPVLVEQPELPQDLRPLTGWHDPRINGGQLLDFTTPELGEPLNVIISGLSDPYVLTEAGLHEYAKAIGFSEECLGLHYGQRHNADLGDGDGQKREQFLARQYYFPIWGTCWESLAGGNHFRAWKQNGSVANSGAWFLGVSKEENSSKHHKIIPNGYNLGRDWLVDRAVSGSKWRNTWWKAEVEWRTDLLVPGSEGVNHDIPQDGRVAVLTVNRMDSSQCSFTRLLYRNALTVSGVDAGIRVCPVPEAADSFLEVVDARVVYGFIFPAWIWIWSKMKERWIGWSSRGVVVRVD